MGLNGHRLNPGEYGYRGERPFHPLKVQDTDVLTVSWMDSERLEDMVIMQEE